MVPGFKTCSLTPGADSPRVSVILFGIHNVGAWLLIPRKLWIGAHKTRFSHKSQGVSDSRVGYLQIKHQEEESVGLISVLQLY